MEGIAGGTKSLSATQDNLKKKKKQQNTRTYTQRHGDSMHTLFQKM